MKQSKYYTLETGFPYASHLLGKGEKFEECTISIPATGIVFTWQRHWEGRSWSEWYAGRFAVRGSNLDELATYHKIIRLAIKGGHGFSVGNPKHIIAALHGKGYQHATYCLSSREMQPTDLDLSLIE